MPCIILLRTCLLIVFKIPQRWYTFQTSHSFTFIIIILFNSTYSWLELTLLSLTKYCLFVLLLILEICLDLELGHHLLPGTVGADNVSSVLDEALAHHGHFADGAEEAAVVPGQLFKGHKLGVAQASFAWKDTDTINEMQSRKQEASQSLKGKLERLVLRPLAQSHIILKLNCRVCFCCNLYLQWLLVVSIRTGDTTNSNLGLPDNVKRWL